MDAVDVGRTISFMERSSRFPMLGFGTKIYLKEDKVRLKSRCSSFNRFDCLLAHSKCTVMENRRRIVRHGNVQDSMDVSSQNQLVNYSRRKH